MTGFPDRSQQTQDNTGQHRGLPRPFPPGTVQACDAGPVRHVKLLIHRLEIDGTDLPVALATLMVVSRPGLDHLDWEVVARTVGQASMELGRNELEMTVVSGADPAGAPELSSLSGAAVVVRHPDSTVVWRGDGALVGFEECWLDP